MNKISKEVILSGVTINETTVFTLTEIRQTYNIDEDFLHAMIEHGIIEPTEHFSIDLQNLRRLQSALRLQQDLEINLAGAALVLDLLDEVEQLQNELAILRRHLT